MSRHKHKHMALAILSFIGVIVLFTVASISSSSITGLVASQQTSLQANASYVVPHDVSWLEEQFSLEPQAVATLLVIDENGTIIQQRPVYGSDYLLSSS